MATRRDVLKALGGLGVLVVGCGNDSAAVDAGSTLDAGFFGGAPLVASGAFLTNKDYPDPFAGGVGTACVAYVEEGAGPCHSNTYFRKEISEGLAGLPTRFQLLVVDAACTPVPGAIAEVWYASPAGTYSKAAKAIDDGTGYTGSLADLDLANCTHNVPDTVDASWLRGWQYSGEDGRVVLDGIFPGWYAARATHVHFAITANGKRYVTSQLFFDDALATAIYTQHPTYSPRGDRDTSNEKDGVILSGLPLASALMSAALQSDGALMCWKTIAIAT